MFFFSLLQGLEQMQVQTRCQRGFFGLSVLPNGIDPGMLALSVYNQDLRHRANVYDDMFFIPHSISL